VQFQQSSQARPISGHVFRIPRSRGPVWYAKYRLPDGRQVQKKIGPAWGRAGRPATGFFTKRTAEAWLREVLAEAHAGTLPGMVRTGVTFGRAAAEWLRYCVEDRACKPSTMVDYRHTIERVLVPAFGPMALEEITPPMIEANRFCARRQVHLDVFSPEEVMALVRAADSEQDAALFLTAAFTGLRSGELSPAGRNPAYRRGRAAAAACDR
jgi:integrase